MTPTEKWRDLADNLKQEVNYSADWCRARCHEAADALRRAANLVDLLTKDNDQLKKKLTPPTMDALSLTFLVDQNNQLKEQLDALTTERDKLQFVVNRTHEIFGEDPGSDDSTLPDFMATTLENLRKKVNELESKWNTVPGLLAQNTELQKIVDTFPSLGDGPKAYPGRRVFFKNPDDGIVRETIVGDLPDPTNEGDWSTLFSTREAAKEAPDDPYPEDTRRGP